MRALSVMQPWATLLATGQKRFETRSWTTPYRGPLAIHAAKGFPREAVDRCFGGPFLSALLATGIRSTSDLPRGAVIATAELVDVGRITSPEAFAYVLGANEIAFGDWTPGRYAWFLHNFQPLAEPIPARGALGLWQWDAPADLALAGGAA
jgi:hypothetical protein